MSPFSGASTKHNNLFTRVPPVLHQLSGLGGLDATLASVGFVGDGNPAPASDISISWFHTSRVLSRLVLWLSDDEELVQAAVANQPANCFGGNGMSVYCITRLVCVCLVILQ